MTFGPTETLTASGAILDFELPRPGIITLRDISTGLCAANRYCGTTIRRAGGPYTVAQHSVVVAKIAERLWKNPVLLLQALLHDAHEAFTGDVTSPLQRAMGSGRGRLLNIQADLDRAIHASIGLALPNEATAERIRHADRVALATEWRDMMPGQCPVAEAPADFHIKPLRWDMAEEQFLKCFDRLSMLAGIRAPKAFHSVFV